MDNYDIAIIGAGLAGSSAAAALARRGWRVALIERRTLPQHRVCGEFLSPEAQHSLRALGLYATVAALHPAPMRHATLVSARGTRLHVDLPDAAWGISRYDLDLALAQGAVQAGATLLQGATVTDLAIAPTQATITYRTSQGTYTLHARTAIIAAGRNPHAALRPRRPDPQAKHRPQYVGVKAHYTGVRMPAHVELYLFEGGYTGVGRVASSAGEVVNVSLLATRAAFQQAGADPAAMLQATAAWNPALAERLAGGTLLADTLVAVAQVDTGRPGAAWDQVARLGDAATMIPPLCGDGMAMALRSAELCVPFADGFLRGTLTREQWRVGYTQAWRRSFARALWVGRRLQSLLATPYLSDVLLHTGAQLPPLARLFVHATRSREVSVAGIR
jgi:flavin-dependent dehydrogenase